MHAFILGLCPGTKALLETHLINIDASQMPFSRVRALAVRCDRTVQLAGQSTKQARRGQAVHLVPHAELQSPPSTPAPLLSQGSVLDVTTTNPVAAPTAGALRFEPANTDPEEVLHVLEVLKPMFSVTEPGEEVDAVETLRRLVHDVDRNPSVELLGATTEVPNLTREQVAMALSAMPSDYWQLVCWSCRGAGHSSFCCPYLTIPQRLFFALCYYRYQVVANPRLSHWFAQKFQA